MTCNRCGGALGAPAEFDAGLCAGCADWRCDARRVGYVFDKRGSVAIPQLMLCTRPAALALNVRDDGALYPRALNRCWEHRA